MPRRIEQFNDQLRNELALLIARENLSDKYLITLTYVETSKDLKYANIGVSVLPDKLSPQVIKKLKKLSSYFCSVLKRKLKIRQIPKFKWKIDKTESRAAVIEEILKQISAGG